jgi:hypothetical protein
MQIGSVVDTVARDLPNLEGNVKSLEAHVGSLSSSLEERLGRSFEQFKSLLAVQASRPRY